jgi:hypothetical protein
MNRRKWIPWQCGKDIECYVLRFENCTALGFARRNRRIYGHLGRINLETDPDSAVPGSEDSSGEGIRNIAIEHGEYRQVELRFSNV